MRCLVNVERHNDLCDEAALARIAVREPAHGGCEPAHSPREYYVTTAQPANVGRFATLEDFRRLVRKYPAGL